jgi:hypothetical protein
MVIVALARCTASDVFHVTAMPEPPVKRNHSVKIHVVPHVYVPYLGAGREG